MPRIRTVKPEMRRDEKVCSWPIPVRYTFVGLLGYLDDQGRGRDDARLVKAELYPIDDDVSARKVEQHLARLSEAGPICRYEVDGQRLLHAINWRKHQAVNRPRESLFPACPLHDKEDVPW